ncbi:TPA: hypothetical protein ACH3X2_005660 [Trebouxia sp. C0005]
MLFAEAGQGSVQRPLGPSFWDYEVYYDPPCEGPAALCEMSLNVTGGAGQLDMSFPGSAADFPACVLVDSGASHGFIVCAFVERAGLQQHAVCGVVHAAGQNSVPVSGFVHVRVQCQSVSEVIKLFVIDMPSPDLHVVLKQMWLNKHKAVLSYAERGVFFLAG